MAVVSDALDARRYGILKRSKIPLKDRYIHGDIRRCREMCYARRNSA